MSFGLRRCRVAVCPRCGFSYAWDGKNCAHCHYPEPRTPRESDQDDRMAERILFKAGQHRLPGGQTHHFEDLEPGLQKEILARAGNRLLGRPVLAFVDSPARWTLLTSREVACLDQGQLRAVNIRDLASVRSDSEPPAVASVEETGRWKRSWEYLRLVDQSGRAQVVWVPCGAEAYALWNILLPYARAGRQAKAEQVAAADRGRIKA